MKYTKIDFLLEDLDYKPVVNKMLGSIQNHFSNNYPLYGGLITGGIIAHQLYDKKKYPILPVLVGCFSGGCVGVVLNSRHGDNLCLTYALCLPIISIGLFFHTQMLKFV